MNRRELVLGAAALSACAPAANGQTARPFPMRRGVNLGNALEAPNEGEWGYRIAPEHLIAIANAGFDGIRLPVRWDAHAKREPPYTISEALLLRVAGIVDQALALGLVVQLDCHHYDALIANPQAERARFLAIWRQIAFDQQDAPGRLIFEPLNEPHGAQWDGALLTQLQTDIVSAIRETNPNRLIVLGPGNWQSIDALARWRPPEAENIAVSVHYYEPHAFTHQGAEWLGAEAPVFEGRWGSRNDLRILDENIAQAAEWARTRALPIQLGEFGVNRAAPLAQRAAWTRAVRLACEAQGIGWCVWDFAGAFPVWDRERGVWIARMREALSD